MTSRWLGFALGLALALVLSGTAVLVVYGQDLGYMLLLALACAALLALLVLLANVAVTVVYMRRQAPSIFFVWQWGPPGFVFVLLMMAIAIDELKIRNFEVAHPTVNEIHINMSGQTIHPATDRRTGPDAVMPGQALGASTEVTRYQYSDKPPLPAYDGVRISALFTTMQVHFGRPDAPDAPDTSVPVIVASTYPDVSSVLSRAHTSTEANTRIYLYHYYADRVEIAPSFMLSGSEAMGLWGRDTPLVEVHVVNLWDRPIARLEMDGAAVKPVRQGWGPDSAEYQCGHRNYRTYAINRFQAPLKVRWQFAEPDARWHEAVVKVPSFRQPKAPPGGTADTMSVDLYFLPDGDVVAERSQVVRQAGDQLVLRTTGPAVPLRTTPPCGTARDRFSDAVCVSSD